ncbi:MAG: hypothetical protein GY940_41785 [bacterium]|nr:hypothetical protein [bacterium]
MAIKLSTSGIRGKFYELMPNRVVKFAQAFSSYIDGKDVIVGADARPSGKYVTEAVISGFMASGSNVTHCGIIPTPVLQWIIKHSDYGGGVSITAGHNSFEWNSLVFLDSEGAYLNHIKGGEFFNLYHSGDYERKRFNQLGTCSENENEIKKYFETFQLNETPNRRLKFVVDCSNGFDSRVIDRLAEALQVQAVPIFCREGGYLQKDPEPTVENAKFLGTIVRETNSDGGFLLNSDASRILVVDEKGIPLSEEFTLPMFALMVLEEEKGEIVTNYSTSKLIDGVAKRYRARVYRTDVGQSYVVQMLQDIRAAIGGEGSGSIVYSPFSLGFDSFVFIKRLVEFMFKHKRKISDIAGSFRTPDIYKETIYLPPNKIYSFLERIGDRYSGRISKKLKDGFYIDEGEEWLCIRASSTMSMIRIVGEGKRITGDIEEVKEMVR